jgi:hypothetical protein
MAVVFFHGHPFSGVFFCLQIGIELDTPHAVEALSG